MNKDLHYIAPEQMALYQAAPELLEACKFLKQYYKPQSWGMKLASVKEAWEKLEQAIARAEGKE